MKNLLILAAIATVGVANAQVYFEHTGVSDNSVGLTGGGNIAWMQGFQVVSNKEVVNSIGTTFGTPAFAGSSGVVAGASFRVHVWTDTDGDMTNGGTTLVGGGVGTIAAGSIDSDVFQYVSVGAVNVGNVGDWFFIGADVDGASGGFPAPLDQAGTPSGTSFVAGSTTAGGFDPNNLAGGIGVFNNGAIGLPGDWLIEANASPVPEPASMLAISAGIAGLLARRRRNK